jgi:homoserine dehydrogenase
MRHYKLAFLGFGNVNRALARLLLQKKAEIAALEAMTFTVTGIATGRHGFAIDQDGIDLQRALALVEAGEGLDSLSTLPQPVSDARAFIRACGAEALFEAIPVSYTDGQPAVDTIRAALLAGMHVFSANKGPVVHAYRALTDLAQANGVKYYFESAVMDGVPVFGLFREILPVVKVAAIRGVLNSTTNLVLTRMENGESLEQAVRYAQSIGVAETDPAGDIDGWDAAVKISALATVLMGVPTGPQDVERTGIRGITMAEVQKAKAEGKRWKLVCEAYRQDETLKCRVSPQKVGAESPLYGVEGTTSIVQIESDVLGRLSLIEEESGLYTTAYGMLADFINAVKKVG